VNLLALGLFKVASFCSITSNLVLPTCQCLVHGVPCILILTVVFFLASDSLLHEIEALVAWHSDKLSVSV
jgi:hypothetical protein